MIKDLLSMLLCGMMEKSGELLLTHRILRMTQDVGNLLTLFLLLIIGILGQALLNFCLPYLHISKSLFYAS